MAEVQADVKMGELLGQTVVDGVYVMSDGKMYSEKDGDFEKVDEPVEIPNYALNNAEQYKENLKLIEKNTPKEESND